MAHHTITVGRHSELLATTALLANGWTVMESVAPEVFDLGITRPGMGREFYRVQVKTARLRTDESRRGNEWVVVPGSKTRGGPYTKGECDYFIGIYKGAVYIFENREIVEYWAKPSEIEEKWERLYTDIDQLKEASA